MSKCTDNPIRHTYIITEDKCFRDGVYFGDVVYQDSKIAKIKIVSDNKYLNGHKFEIKVDINTAKKQGFITRIVNKIKLLWNIM